ncbi:DUF742 domain-containing protein [Nocardia cyriacigeorgica]|uniref:DUF742 domain-containing protein n=1 Tax=Nocardia cyriacigeorgica TaxID=135487 RepID=UPI0013D6F92A|nr:DUF742 domain-containing protein [Nocardia cyriacigeorgica]NEW26643.1 DUF742 domain-containing protein [Nocardia cyriacigeorgica]
MSDDPDQVSRPDDDPGPLVRPFALTRGRAGRGLPDLDLLTLVISIGSEDEMNALEREYVQIYRLCRDRPLSIAELAAHLGLLVVTVKVLVGDLVAAGYVLFRSPPPPDAGPDPDLIRAVLDGLRRL